MKISIAKKILLVGSIYFSLISPVFGNPFSANELTEEELKAGFWITFISCKKEEGMNDQKAEKEIRLISNFLNFDVDLIHKENIKKYSNYLKSENENFCSQFVGIKDFKSFLNQYKNNDPQSTFNSLKGAQLRAAEVVSKYVCLKNTGKINYAEFIERIGTQLFEEGFQLDEIQDLTNDPKVISSSKWYSKQIESLNCKISPKSIDLSKEEFSKITKNDVTKEEESFTKILLLASCKKNKFNLDDTETQNLMVDLATQRELAPEKMFQFFGKNNISDFISIFVDEIDDDCNFVNNKIISKTKSIDYPRNEVNTENNFQLSESDKIVCEETKEYISSLLKMNKNKLIKTDSGMIPVAAEIMLKREKIMNCK